MMTLIGRAYDPLIESDILLLDISNDEEYIWTSDFEPSISSPTSTLLPSATSPAATASTTSPQSSSIQAAMISAIVICGILILAFGCLFLYRLYKNKQKQDE